MNDAVANVLTSHGAERETFAASEQRSFCDDIVGQWTQSIRRLAIQVWQAPQWFCWWD